MSEAPDALPAVAAVEVTPATVETPAAPSPAEAAPSEGSVVAEVAPVEASPADDAPKEGADSESGEVSALDPAAYDLTLPDDFTVDPALMTDARAAFAAAGVPLDKAQSLLDLYTRAASQANEAAVTAFNAQQTAWKTTLDAMPEFKGPTRETSLAAIGRVFDEFGPAAKEAFNNPALGNNPEVVKFMLKVANALSEGTSAPASRVPSPKRANSGGLLGLSYPNTPEIQGT